MLEFDVNVHHVLHAFLMLYKSITCFPRTLPLIFAPKSTHCLRHPNFCIDCNAPINQRPSFGRLDLFRDLLT